jgi:hypothetical protein
MNGMISETFDVPVREKVLPPLAFVLGFTSVYVMSVSDYAA